MTHALGDRGQRWEVSFFNPTTNARQVYGWTDDQAVALKMADSVEKHPSWAYPQVTDRRAIVTPKGECVNKDKVRPGFEIHDCPNMKEVEGDLSMDREHYKCDVCGKRDYLDYEEMK